MPSGTRDANAVTRGTTTLRDVRLDVIQSVPAHFKERSMTRAILATAVSSLATILMGAADCSAHDGLPLVPTSACGCSANNGCVSDYNYPRVYAPPSDCSSGRCMNGAAHWEFGPEPFRRQGSWDAPNGYAPRYIYPDRTAPFYGSPQPYSGGFNGEPDLPSAPSPTYRPKQPRPSISSEGQAPIIPAGMDGIAELPPAEQVAALRQKTCPVTQEPLGSMGKPIRVSVAGQTIFVCCEGCVSAVQRNPQKYLQGVLRSNPAIMMR